MELSEIKTNNPLIEDLQRKIPLMLEKDQQIQDFEGVKIEVISQHHTNAIVYKASQENEEVCLKVETGDNPKALREYNYLNANQDLNLYPKMYFSGKTPQAEYYCMEYFGNAKTLSTLNLQDNITEECIGQLMNLLGNIPSRKPSKSELEAVYQKNYLDRLSYRLDLLEKSPLGYMLMPEKIVINGYVYPNLRQFWSKCLQAFPRAFFNQLGPYPGDLHFENIILTSKGMKVIDPQGSLELPIEYDLGKLLHSTHGQYDFIKRKRFHLEEHTSDSYQFYIGPVHQNLVNSLNKSVLERFDSNVLIGTYLTEVFHFSTLIAHHVGNIQEAKAFYLKTLQLTKEFSEMVGL